MESMRFKGFSGILVGLNDFSGALVDLVGLNLILLDFNGI